MRLPAATTGLALSPRIDPYPGSTQLVREKALYGVTVMQPFAIDNTNGRVYTVQLTDSTGARNLTVTQLDMAVNRLGHMFLTGLGHGVQIGVDRPVRRRSDTMGNMLPHAVPSHHQSGTCLDLPVLGSNPAGQQHNSSPPPADYAVVEAVVAPT